MDGLTVLQRALLMRPELCAVVLAGTGGEHGQIGMGKGGSGYDDPVESGSRQCLVEVGENRYAELSAGLVAHLRVGVQHFDDALARYEDSRGLTALAEHQDRQYGAIMDWVEELV